MFCKNLHNSGQDEVSLDGRGGKSAADLNNNQQAGSEFARRMQVKTKKSPKFSNVKNPPI